MYRLFLAILLFCIATSYSYINITTCNPEPNWASEGEFRLNQSIEISSGDCFYIDSSNILLDCQNNLINSTDNSLTSYGIRVSGSSSNVTVQNCKIENFGNSDPDNEAAIRSDSDLDITFKNLVLLNNFVGVLPYSNNYFENITANFGEYGFYLTYVDGATFIDINAINNSDSGIYLNFNSNSNIFSSIRASDNNYGIFIEGNSNVKNNTFITGDLRGNVYNIYLNSGFGNPKDNIFTQLYLGNSSKIYSSPYNATESGNTFNKYYWDDYSFTNYCGGLGSLYFCDTLASLGPVQSSIDQSNTNKVLPLASSFSLSLGVLLIVIFGGILK